MLDLVTIQAATRSAYAAFTEDVAERGAAAVARECGMCTATAKRIAAGIGVNRGATQRKVMLHALRIGKGDVENIGKLVSGC